MPFQRSIRASENTINEIVGEYLRSCGVDELGQQTVPQFLRGVRTPDLIVNMSGNYYLGEGEWNDSLLAGYDQARIYNELPGSSGSFLLVYPSGLHDIINNRPPGPVDPYKILSQVQYDLWIMLPGQTVRCHNSIDIDDIPSHLMATYSGDIANQDADMLINLLARAVEAIGIEIQDQGAILNRQTVLAQMLGGPPASEATMDRVQSAAAYLLVDQMAFYHVLSHFQSNLFPPIEVDSIRSFNDLQRYFDNSLEVDYDSIFSVKIASSLRQNTLSIICSILRIIHTLPPDFLAGGTLGTIFHQLIPLNIRKPLGAYYTLPGAASILAGIAIDDVDTTIIDPACGSGNLLTASYRRLKELIEENSSFSEEDHVKLLGEQIIGVDFMPFAAHLSAIHLAIQYPHHLSETIRVGIHDSMTLKVGSKILPLSLALSRIQALGQTSLTTFEEDDPFKPTEENDDKRIIEITGSDLVIMNPPFTRFQNMANFQTDYIQKLRRFYFQNLNGYIDGKMSFSNYFILKAEKFLNNQGKIAAVLPATVLVGESTKGIREYISKNYNVDVVIIRDDHCRFSEDTDLQEILLVLSKKAADDPQCQEFINYIVLHQLDPSFTVQIRRALEANHVPGDYPNDNFLLRKVDYSTLSLDNWFYPIALTPKKLYDLPRDYFTDIDLLGINEYLTDTQHIQVKNHAEPSNTMKFSQGIICTSNSTVRGKIWDFHHMDGRNIYCHFGGDESQIIPVRRNNCRKVFRSRANINQISINTLEEYVLYSNPGRQSKRFIDFARIRNRDWARWTSYLDSRTSRFGLIDRIDISSPNTSILAYCDDNPRIWARVAATITNVSEIEAKVLALWFNSTFGMLEYFKNRSPQRAYFQIQMPGIKSMMIPNIRNFSNEQKDELKTLYDEVSQITFPSIIEQFVRLTQPNNINTELIQEHFGNSQLLGNGFQIREQIDRELLRILGADVDLFDRSKHELYKSVLHSLVIFSNYMKK